VLDQVMNEISKGPDLDRAKPRHKWKNRQLTTKGQTKGRAAQKNNTKTKQEHEKEDEQAGTDDQGT